MESGKNCISVIIPVYNVQDYIKECLESVINQSYRNLEIILIDDGSTDYSGKICDEYAKEDARIIVIHQKNGGAGSAKNAGLRIATGKYLSFVDSDDWLEPGAFAYMVAQLEKNNVDVIQCGYRDVYINKIENQNVTVSCEEYDVKTYLKKYTTDWTCGLLWDKLYKRELFEGIFFEEGHVIDDEFFTYQGIMNADKIRRVPNVVYNYRKRKSSVTTKPEYKEKIIFDKLEYLCQRRRNIPKKYPELKKDFDIHYINMLNWMIEDACTEKSVRVVQKKIGEYFDEKDNTKVSMLRRLRLKKSQNMSEKYFVKRNSKKVTEVNIDNYFE